jgi:hypothetical protein
MIKVLEQLEKSVNAAIDSLKNTMTYLNGIEIEERKTLGDSNKYDEEMTEEEKKIYEEEYLKEGEPLPNSCLRSYTSGDWVRMWLEPYRKKQIEDVFYPLVDFLLNDAEKERPQFNEFRRVMLFEDIRKIDHTLRSDKLKDSQKTQDRIVETLIKIFPKNRPVFFKTINNIEDAFYIDIKEHTDLKKFLTEEENILKKYLTEIKNTSINDLKKIFEYLVDKKEAWLASMLSTIERLFNDLDIYNISKDFIEIQMIPYIDLIIKNIDKPEYVVVLNNFKQDLEKLADKY